jgi:hypothetical protein
MQCLQDVTGAEFKMFMDFLKSLALFGPDAPPERVQELLEIVEGQADLDAVFNVCISPFFRNPNSLSVTNFSHFKQIVNEVTMVR